MQDEIDSYAQTLADDGVVVMNDFISEDVCDELYLEISTSIEDNEIDVIEGGGYSYSELVNWGSPVATKRTARDDGMIDVFNIDDVVGEVESFKTNKKVKKNNQPGSFGVVFTGQHQCLLESICYLHSRLSRRYL